MTKHSIIVDPGGHEHVLYTYPFVLEMRPKYPNWVPGPFLDLRAFGPAWVKMDLAAAEWEAHALAAALEGKK